MDGKSLVRTSFTGRVPSNTRQGRGSTHTEGFELIPL